MAYGFVLGGGEGLWNFLLHLCERILIQTAVIEILIHASVMPGSNWNDFVIENYLHFVIKQNNTVMILNSHWFLCSNAVWYSFSEKRISIVHHLQCWSICFSKSYFSFKCLKTHRGREIWEGLSNGLQLRIYKKGGLKVRILKNAHSEVDANTSTSDNLLIS